MGTARKPDGGRAAVRQLRHAEPPSAQTWVSRTSGDGSGWALSQASASVAPRMGRTETLKAGERPGGVAAWMGYGERNLRVRASLASSIDGGIFFDVAFDPVSELDARVEQR